MDSHDNRSQVPEQPHRPGRREQMRTEIRRRLEVARDRRRRVVAPDPPPRYDDVFFEGTAWLDENG